MSLKITGRTPTSARMKVSEGAQSPMQAKEIAMRCEACGKSCYAMLPYQPTPHERLALMRAAMNEHRQICKVGAPEDQRTYSVLYPRA